MSEESNTEEEFKEEFKCYIGRVPTKFNEEIVQRNLVEKLGDKNAVQKVELIYPHEEDGDNSKNINNNNNDYDSYREDRMTSASHKPDETAAEEKEHRGFGFVYFSSALHRDAALEFRTIKGKRKTTSKKSYSMYLRPYVAKSFADESLDPQEDGETSTQPMGRDVCHLWSLKRCPYGDECKFRHVGEGGCLVQEKDLSPEQQKLLKRKRKGKCFVYKKKGTCPKGDDCPFSHDFEPDLSTTAKESTTCKIVSTDQKDCINWKTKGKCRKGDKCPYKHDPELQKRALDKIAKKKRLREGGAEETSDADKESGSKRQRKEKQPLSVRIFGLNYDTTEQDIREFVEKTCGHPIKTMVFPRFEDSGRSKGYCGVYFASPKAAKAAVETCDNAELHGRWLRVQTGKSMTIDAWEGLHRS